MANRSDRDLPNLRGSRGVKPTGEIRRGLAEPIRASGYGSPHGVCWVQSWNRPARHTEIGPCAQGGVHTKAMAVRRDKDTGETIEEPTRRLGPGGKEPPSGSTGESPTDVPPPFRGFSPAVHADDAGRSVSAPGGGSSPFDAPTQRIATGQQSGIREEQTRLLRPEGVVAGANHESPGEDAMADPVTGWLVVISGPGKGRVCPLGYGSNALGRGEGSRIRLDFGDDRISREGHATLTYDSRGRKFYLQHGGGKNLTYLKDRPVLAPTILEAMQDFSVGETTLRFVPLCGPEFDWQDVDSE